MRFRTKVVILVAAVLITLVGFNLIASTGAADIIKVGKQAGYEMISNFLAKAGSQPTTPIRG